MNLKHKISENIGTNTNSEAAAISVFCQSILFEKNSFEKSNKYPTWNITTQILTRRRFSWDFRVKIQLENWPSPVTVTLQIISLFSKTDGENSHHCLGKRPQFFVTRVHVGLQRCGIFRIDIFYVVKLLTNRFFCLWNKRKLLKWWKYERKQ